MLLFGNLNENFQSGTQGDRAACSKPPVDTKKGCVLVHAPHLKTELVLCFQREVWYKLLGHPVHVSYCWVSASYLLIRPILPPKIAVALVVAFVVVVVVARGESEVLVMLLEAVGDIGPPTLLAVGVSVRGVVSVRGLS